MVEEISLFIHALFLESVESSLEISQEYEILEGMTILELINDFCDSNRKLRFKFLDEQDNLRPNINIFVGSINCKRLKGLDSKLAKDDKVSIFPALSGG